MHSEQSEKAGYSRRSDWLNGKRWIVTSEQANSRWGSSRRDKTGPRCGMCGRYVKEGEGCRFIYMNGGQGPGGNFTVCDSCDGEDIVQRRTEMVEEFLRVKEILGWGDD